MAGSDCLNIPVYVVTGFLGSGKTTLINEFLKKRLSKNSRLLLVQFESGKEEASGNEYVCDILSFSKKELKTDPKLISERISACIDELSIDEVWVEWNGMTEFSALQSIFIAKSLISLCGIKKVIHVADAKTLRSLLGKTGPALPEQLSNCDCVVLRNAELRSDSKKAIRIIHGLNPGVKVYDVGQIPKIVKQINSKGIGAVGNLSLGLLCFVAVYLLVSSVFNLENTSVNTLINIFIGIILQAIPFLLIGVLISSAIQVFVPREAIERRFPKNLALGMLTAIIMGFCLPVCDCASVPIFRSLVKKGVPLPVAVTFLTAAPVINPIVMLSTYYAFNGIIRIVALRVGLGIVASLLIGLFFYAWPSKKELLSNGFDGQMCSCGCYAGIEEIKGIKDKLRLFIRHSEAEFFNVGKFLMIGAFVSALFQSVGVKTLFMQTASGYALAIFFMMALAFFLSLCSSSDAIIARSFSSIVPYGAVMGFLVFGPMMDIKNLIMLSGGFSKKFVLKLSIATFVICYLVVVAFAQPLLGV